VALLHQNERAPAEARTEEQMERLAAHEADPVHNPYPLLPSNYDFFLPQDAASAENMRRMLEPDFDPATEGDEADLYTARREGAEENDSFRFAHQREYESGHILDCRQHPYQEVALVLNDGDGERARGAYFYAINSKMQLKPRRNVNLSQVGAADEDEKIDVVNVSVRDLNEEERQMRDGLRARLEDDEIP
jgi:hypothetical protein